MTPARKKYFPDFFFGGGDANAPSCPRLLRLCSHAEVGHASVGAVLERMSQRCQSRGRWGVCYWSGELTSLFYVDRWPLAVVESVAGPIRDSLDALTAASLSSYCVLLRRFIESIGISQYKAYLETSLYKTRFSACFARIRENKESPILHPMLHS